MTVGFDFGTTNSLVSVIVGNRAIDIMDELGRPYPSVVRYEGEETVVTWTMSGGCNFMRKAVGLFMDCDNMCGGFFEKGLADMKAIAEAPAVAK